MKAKFKVGDWVRVSTNCGNCNGYDGVIIRVGVDYASMITYTLKGDREPPLCGSWFYEDELEMPVSYKLMSLRM